MFGFVACVCVFFVFKGEGGLHHTSIMAGVGMGGDVSGRISNVVSRLYIYPAEWGGSVVMLGVVGPRVVIYSLKYVVYSTRIAIAVTRGKRGGFFCRRFSIFPAAMVV